MKNPNLISFLVLLAGIALLMVTSMLLELDFFNRKIVRQIIVYFIMLFEAYVMFRILKNINQNN
jgi:hypothetical protein